MKRYGGDLRKAKRILLLSALIIALLWIPILWAGDEINSPINFFSIPIIWAYGLIFLPIALNFALFLTRRLFERANR